jgi:hypothetical protein
VGARNALAFQAPDLKIVLMTENIGGSPDKESEAVPMDWKKSCKNLGNRLRVGKGPFGFGMFANYSCFLGAEKISGKSGDFDWVLEVKIAGNEASFIIKNKDRIEARQALSATVSLVRYLQDPGFCDDIVFGLMRSLPVLMAAAPNVQSKGHFGRGISISDATNLSSARFEPPPDLILFHLSYNQNLKVWIPEEFGKATLRYYDKAKFSQNDGGKSRGRVFWDVSLSAAPVKNEPIWAQVKEGRGQLMEESKVNAKIQTAYDLLEVKFGKRKSTLFGSVTSYLVDSAASGYVGARYGRQFLAGDDLLGNSSFWGLLVEIRSGPLEGLRFYYDEVPKITSQVESGETYLEWSRFTAGMSFGIFPGILIDRIDFVPKIGKWSLSAILPIHTPDQTLRQEFQVKDRLSLALEAGLEWIGDWYTIRTWASQDQSIVYGNIDTSGVITSRIGLDTYLIAGPSVKISSGKLKTTLLLFSVLESIKLRAAKGPAEESEKFRIDEIDFDSGYAGGGLVISW